MNATATWQELSPVVARARRLAADLQIPVGPRELLLALATTDPRLLVSAARRHGIDAVRLALALAEWLPANGGIRGAPHQPVPITAPARAAIMQAAAGATADPRDARELLLDHLLRPSSAGPVSDCGPDTTNAVLRALALI